MIHISRKRIEREIESQRKERERREGVFIKKPKKISIPKKPPKKRVYKKRKPHNQKPKIKEKVKRTDSEIQKLILKTLRLNGPLTRKELMDGTNTPMTTLFDNMDKLLKRNLLIKYSVRTYGKRGRPVVVWGLSQITDDILELNES